jgi:hypothetical protein
MKCDSIMLMSVRAHCGFQTVCCSGDCGSHRDRSHAFQSAPWNKLLKHETYLNRVTRVPVVAVDVWRKLICGSTRSCRRLWRPEAAASDKATTRHAPHRAWPKGNGVMITALQHSTFLLALSSQRRRCARMWGLLNASPSWHAPPQRVRRSSITGFWGNRIARQPRGLSRMPHGTRNVPLLLNIDRKYER